MKLKMKLIVFLCTSVFQEFQRERQAHNVLQFQFKEMKETLKQTEELLTVGRTNTHNKCTTVGRTKHTQQIHNGQSQKTSAENQRSSVSSSWIDVFFRCL